jgi:hypothetical protein
VGDSGDVKDKRKESFSRMCHIQQPQRIVTMFSHEKIVHRYWKMQIGEFFMLLKSMV